MKHVRSNSSFRQTTRAPHGFLGCFLFCKTSKKVAFCFESFASIHDKLFYFCFLYRSLGSMHDQWFVKMYNFIRNCQLIFVLHLTEMIKNKSKWIFRRQLLRYWTQILLLTTYYEYIGSCIVLAEVSRISIYLSVGRLKDFRYYKDSQLR